MTDLDPWVAHPDYPGLLRAWDATALRLFMTCPRRFFYKQVEGWRPRPRPQVPGEPHAHVHLDFGTMWHACVELYDTMRLQGSDHDEAMDHALRYALTQSWDLERGEPWGGQVMTLWTCTGVENPTGKRRKFLCEAAKGEWVTTPLRDYKGEGVCPKCGREITERTAYVPHHPSKNRTNLLRAVYAYCEEQATSGLRPATLEDGSPALELKFELDLPRLSPDGRPYVLCGHIDRVTEFASGGGSGVFPHERKTTTSALGRKFWGNFAPDPQIDTYDWAAHRLYLGHEGVIIEAVQVMQGGVRLARTIVHRGPESREEWEREIQDILAEAEACAGLMVRPEDAQPDDAYVGAEAWSRKTSSCRSAAGGQPCEFRDVCAAAPSTRGRMLEVGFERQPLWNPLHED